MNSILSAKLCQLPVIGNLVHWYELIADWLAQHSDGLPPLLLRLILAYEFWEAGIEKLNGNNWFDHIEFPFPFNLLSGDLLWFMGTWMELLGALALVVGLGTRFFVFGLMVLTFVAAKAVHWPSDWNSLAEFWQGYAITNKGHGNFKLPLLYLIMFTPLLFGGAGRWSLDHWLGKFMKQCNTRPD